MKKTIKILITFAVLVLLVYAFKGTIESKIRSAALSAIGAVIDPKTKDILIEQRQISESLAQAQTVNTHRQDMLMDEVKRLQRQNQSLRSELDRIGGEISSVSTSVSEINLAGADTVDVGEGDFTHPYQDPWIKAMIEREEGKLRFEYETTFRVEEFDVEVTLPDGTVTHLFNTALVSESTGDTLHVPTVRRVIERKPGASRFHLNPQLHLRAGGGLGRAWGGLGVSAFSWGESPTIEGAKFYFIEGAAMYGDGFTVVAVPASWNAARVLPLVKNLSVGVGWAWGKDNSGPVVVIGAAL